MFHRHPTVVRSLSSFAEADLSHTLAAVDVPILLLYGQLDVRSPRRVWEPIHRGTAHSKLVVIPGVGHMVDMQAPTRCNAEIRTLVDQIERTDLPG